MQISEKLVELENIIKTDSKVQLPRLMPLDKERDASKIEDLYKSLAQAINDFEISHSTDFFNVPSFYLLGTRIIQTDFSKFKITCDGKRAEFDEELNILVLQEFLREKSIDIFSSIRNINIAVEYSTGDWTPLKTLTEYLEFVTADNFCLRNGKWCFFNNAYSERVLAEVERIPFKNNIESSLRFNKSELIDFAQQSGIYTERRRQPYEDYFNAQLENILSATCQHPNAEKFEEGYSFRFEPCDLFTDEELFFVKIGEPSDFATAVNQASLTLQKMKNSLKNTIEVKDGRIISPKKFVLILVFDKRKTIVSQWSDIKSLNFLILLSSLKNDLSLSGIVLQIEFCYENDIDEKTPTPPAPIKFTIPTPPSDDSLLASPQ